MDWGAPADLVTASSSTILQDTPITRMTISSAWCFDRFSLEMVGWLVNSNIFHRKPQPSHECGFMFRVLTPLVNASLVGRLNFSIRGMIRATPFCPRALKEKWLPSHMICFSLFGMVG